ncbi:hypothetical protein RRG08_010580 [Elysia crispata]|uniref:Uncharacterized protein n=1 Tax=Elysia crispata TaxID=231223 RepID=A0AAE1DM01_9GAST|nr:hypothetical protein RRG08_010580 [Elysia crispata]
MQKVDFKDPNICIIQKVDSTDPVSLRRRYTPQTPYHSEGRLHRPYMTQMVDSTDPVSLRSLFPQGTNQANTKRQGLTDRGR